MFSILNVTTYLPKKSFSSNELVVDSPMVEFYSQTLEIVIKFLKEIGCKEKHSLKLLQEFIDKSFDLKRFHNSKMNLLDDLRFLIMTSLDNPSKRNRKSLRNIHSLLHLIVLTNNDKLSPFYILNTWLNSNCLLKDDEDVLHAMRGNIGNLLKIYPDSREALEEIAKIESNYRNDKISIVKYNLLKDEWSQKFKKFLPYKIYKVFMQNYDSEFHWTEILCCKLAYGNSNRNFLDLLNSIKHLIPENDEIYLILKCDYKTLMKNSKGWLKFVYCFLFNLENKFDIFQSLIEIGEYLLDIDWQIALDYFSFTMYSNYYFNRILLGIELNHVKFDFLFRYAKRNNLDTSFLFEIYSKNLLEKKDFLNYLNFICINKIDKFVIEKDFIKFLIKNFKQIENILTVDFRKNEIGRYLELFKKVRSDITKKEIIEFVNHQYTLENITLLLNIILDLQIIEEYLLIKFLDLILYQQNELLLSDNDLINFKIKIIKKLQMLTEN